MVRRIQLAIALLFGAFAVTAAGGLYFATAERVSNEAWIAIGTAAYATFTFLAFVVLLAAAWYAWQQVESGKKSIRINMLDRLSTQWESELLREARQIANESGGERLGPVLELYDLRNAKEFYALSALANFFEELGMLVGDGHIDVEDVTSRFRMSIVYYGYLFSDYIEEGRKQNEDHLANFRRVAAAMAFASMTRRSV